MSGEAFLVIVLASVLGAFVKGVTGLGYPLFVIPLAALATGVTDAVVVVAVPNLIANAWLCWRSREARHDARDLARILVPGVAGAVVGTLLLVGLPEDPLLVALAVTVLAYVVVALRDPAMTLAPDLTHRWSPVAGGLTGVMQGAVGVSGPVIASWLHGYRLRTEAYVFSVTLVFGLTGAVQIVVLATQGEFTGARAAGSLAAAVPLAVFLPIGSSLRARLDGPAFAKAVLVVLAASAVSLPIRVFT